MTESPTPRRRWSWTGWDAVTALGVGIAAAIVSVFHQETVGVCLLSGAVTAVLVFLIVPLGRMLRRS